MTQNIFNNSKTFVRGPLFFLYEEKPLQTLYFKKADESWISSQTVLENFETVIKVTLEALKAAIDQKTFLFDPLVGENACQIRTAMFVLLFNDKNHVKALKKAYEKIAKIYPILKKKIQKQALLPSKVLKKIYLNSFLDQEGLNIQIPKLVHLILHSYLLTITKTSVFSLVRNPKTHLLETSLIEDNLQKALFVIRPNSISRKASESFYKNARKIVSELSTRFILENADIIAPGFDKVLMEHYLITDERGLEQLPCYYSMKVIWCLALKTSSSIVLNLQRIEQQTGQTIDYLSFLFVPDPSKSCFVLEQDFSHLKRGQVYFKIDAVSIGPKVSQESFIQEFSRKDFLEWILAFAGAHPQYGGMENKREIPDNKEIQIKKEQAIKEGFCRENPITCQPWHIYPEIANHSNFLN